MSITNGSERWNLLSWTLTAGWLLLLFAGDQVTCLRGSAVVLQAKAKAAEAKEATIVEGASLESDGNSTDSNSTDSTQPTKAKSLLTGIPQKDYIYDPNLPRELNGHNLTNYPFYNAVPDDIHFECDGLHDGFYASVPHKCQVYHHCLFGTRYDFLCANYTAFDQKTFICHFVSEVDCDNSPKYFKRNEALYKAATTNPPSTTTTAKPSTTTTPPPPPPPPPPRRAQGTSRRHRRPYPRRRRPIYDYYYDEYYDDPEYDDDIIQPPRRKPQRKHRPHGGNVRDDDSDFDSQPEQMSTDMIKPSVRPSTQSSQGSGSVYDRPRIPPKVRRPVPINERDKYDYTQKTSDVAPAPTSETAKDERGQQRKPQPQPDDDYYYDDEYEEEQPKYKKKQSDYDVGSTGTGEGRRQSNRHRLRLQNRKRPDRYDDEDADEDDYEQEERPRSRKGQRHDDYSPRSSRPRGNRGKLYSRDEEAVPAERPGYISGGRTGATNGSNRKRPHNTEYVRTPSRKHQERRPLYEDEEEDDEYYDDEEEEIEDEKVSRRNQKQPSNKYNGRRDDEYSEDQRNGRRQNSKTTTNSNNSQKAASSIKQTERTKNEEIDNARQSFKNNDRFNNDKTDLSSRQSVNERYNNNRTELNNNKNNPSVNKDSDNPKVLTTRPSYRTTSGDLQKPGSADKYDDEYEDDYEETKPLSPSKSNGNLNERSDSSREGFFRSRNENSNSQNNKQDSTISSDDTSKSTGTYKSTTTAPVQEQSSTYTRNSNIFRGKTSSPIPVTDDIKPSTSTTPVTSLHRFSSTLGYENDYAEQDSSQNYYKPENRTRILSAAPVSNFKKQSTTTPLPVDKSESSKTDEKSGKEFLRDYDSSEKPLKDLNLESVAVSGPSRPFVSVGLFRRPLKSTTSNTIETTTTVSDPTPTSAQKSLSAVGYRRVIKPNEAEEKLRRKEPSYPITLTGGYRRPTKVTELDKTLAPTTEAAYEDNLQQKNPQPQIPSSGPGNTQYRKPYKPADTTTESTVTSRNNEEAAKTNSQPPAVTGNNYRRPVIYSRPVVEDYPAEYDDTQKPAQFPPTGSGYRRPYKTQKLPETPSSTENAQLDYNESPAVHVPPSGPGGGFRRPVEVAVKNEGSTIINLRSHYGFFNPGRQKPTGNDNLPTAPDSTAYPRVASKNIIEKPESGFFSRQPPRNLDITAPGPSGPDNLNHNTRTGFRNNDFNEAQNPSSNANLDITDEEYDVTLNDALQPSTLHPTRSLTDYPHQTRVKARGFLSAVTHPSGFSNNHAVAPFLLSTSSSQQYVSRVQNVQPLEKSHSATSNMETKNENMDSQASAGDEGYEAVVLSAPQYDRSASNVQRWVNQRQSTPSEWYW